ncbi:acyltransferase, partial [Bifidobacteriaceae bacterium WP012]
KTVFYNPLHAWQRSLIGIVTTIVLILCFVYADGTSSAFTFGGYTITAAVCALILWSCTQTDNICSRIFAFAPLSYLGKRAFAIYLVHFPILELCNPATRTTTVSWEEQILQAVIIVAVAECFYQLFEKQTEKYLQKLVHFVALAIACVITIFLIALPLNWNSIAQQRAIQIRP